VSTVIGAPAPTQPEPGAAPARAAGVELLGEVPSSGYERAPALVRRVDGQMIQLTPILYAVLRAIDGERDHAALAQHLASEQQLLMAPADIEHLVEAKLRPLGVLRGVDGVEPDIRRSNPLLALRCRFVVSNPRLTARLAAPFTGLFAPAVAVAVLVAFASSTAWLLFDEGLAAATRDALYEPSLLLLVVGLSVLSAGFHELGHAAACQRGGARPGAMGVGLYLVWPAFYTDVSDSYRLDRRGRLRVDAGGLYFNAVFSVAIVGAWAITGADALLVVVPIQLLQMLRQLVPLVRFDGYHLLADLVGVPDLFARLKPTLLGMLPNRWGDPETKVLKPWARVVVATWVLLVVPLLATSLVLMALALPRVAATAWDSLGVQWSAMATHWSDGRLARAAVGAVAVVGIALPALGVIYLLSRIAGRGLTFVWRSTEGNQPRRAAAALALAGAAMLLAHAWWPDGQYEPIRAGERGTLLDGLQALAGVESTALSVTQSGSTAPRVDADSAEAEVAPTDSPASSAAAGPASGGYRFTPPGAPGPEDNQALATNYTDGSTLIEVSPSLVWVTDGSVGSTNQAYALASCADCATVAVAFQVVLAVGTTPEIGPQNEAVAVNRDCSACRTQALAMQTVLTVPELPSVEERAQLAALWDRVEAVMAAAPSTGLSSVRSQLDALESEIAELLGATVAANDQDVDDEVAPGSADATSTSTSTAPSTTTTMPAGETTTTAPTSTTVPDTSTTTVPSSTTTTEAVP
jgi:putative peptide zinc metalloprotease protein